MICEQNRIQSLDFFVSFFVKKKRKENRIISQIEIVILVMNLIWDLIGGTKANTKIKINRNLIVEIGAEPVEFFDRFKHIKHSNRT